MVNCHTMSFIANDLRLKKYIQFRPNHICLQSILNDAGKLKEEDTNITTHFARRSMMLNLARKHHKTTIEMKT